MSANSPVRFMALAWLLAPGLALLCFLVGVSPVQAADTILYVDRAAGGSNDGSSWPNAYTTLPAALAAATSGDEIWVASGVYTPGVSLDSSFVLTDGVALYGGFAGGETNLSQRDWQANVTVLSGDLAGDDTFKTSTGVVTDTVGIQGNNAHQVVIGSGTDSSAVLDGFTITAGNAAGAFVPPCGPACGGGQYNEGGNPTLANVTFSGNRAAFGGGMYNIGGSSPSLANVTFRDNVAAFYGGGLANYDSSSPSLTHVSFSGNRAAFGGGMTNITSSNPSLVHVTISGNQADWGGGGMYNIESSPTLTHVVFTGNRTIFLDGFGGGMFSYYGAPRLVNVEFSGNNAVRRGGGMDNDHSSPNLTNVTFSGNAASTGGGMANTAGSPLLQNSLFWGNNATSGVGIYNDLTSSPTIRYSLVQSGLPAGSIDGGGNLDGLTGPQFVRDPDPGDADWSTLADNDYGDLRLHANSPAIDAGDNDADLDGALPGLATIAGVPTDLGGQPRLAALRTAVAAVDLGAYETANQLPGFTSSPALTATEDQPYVYLAVVLDPDPPLGASLTFSATSLPAWLTLTDHQDGTATLGGTPTNVEVGLHAVALQVTDQGGAVGGMSFTLAVANVNDTPTFTSTPVTTATEDSLYAYAVTTADIDVGDSRTLTLTTAPAWVTLSDHGDGTATLSGTPTNDLVGVHAVEVRVEDAAGALAVQSFAITVGNTNDAPIFTSSAPTATMVAAQYSYTITTDDIDVGDTRTLTATTKPAWLQLTAAGDGGTLVGVPPADAVGSHPVVLRVQDAGGLVAEQSFTVVVAAAPIQTGGIVGLIYVDSDGDGQQNTGEPGVPGVTVTLEDVPLGVARAALVGQTVTDNQGDYAFTEVPVGDYILRFTVPPGFELPPTGTLEVTVRANQVTFVPGFSLSPLGDQVDNALYLPSTRK